MKRVKTGFFILLLSGSTLLSACGVRHAADKPDLSSFTVQETAECTMESLQSLDLEQFNQCTDNYVETWHNWLGIPVESEYRVFNELLQPGLKVGKRKKKYEFSYKLNKKIMENLTWEIGAIKEDGDRAEIEMDITNLDMSDVMAKYEIGLWENMIASAEGGKIGFWQMIKDVSGIMDDDSGLLAVVNACDQDEVCMLHVTVKAYREDGAWKIHLDEAFLNAVMGNMYADEYSEEMEREVEALEKEYEERLEEWGEQITYKMERWMN